MYEDQFDRVARSRGWSSAEKLDALVQHLREGALIFFHSLSAHDKGSYKRVASRMDERFGRSDPPPTARRRLQAVKQEVDEEIEAFGERCIALARDGHPSSSEEMVQQMAVDAFLRGCNDRQAAVLAGEKDLSTIREAIQSVKHSVANAKFLGGDRDKKIRAIHAPAEACSSTVTLDSLSKELKLIREALSSARREESPSPMARSRSRSSSPVCFRCRQEGHYKRDCPETRKKYVCYACNQEGHLKRDCPSTPPVSPSILRKQVRIASPEKVSEN